MIICPKDLGSQSVVELWCTPTETRDKGDNDFLSSRIMGQQLVLKTLDLSLLLSYSVLQLKQEIKVTMISLVAESWDDNLS